MKSWALGSSPMPNTLDILIYKYLEMWASYKWPQGKRNAICGLLASSDPSHPDFLLFQYKKPCRKVSRAVNEHKGRTHTRDPGSIHY